MSAIIIENGLVHYEAFGRGQPLIFIHGWLGSWRYWVPTMDDLSDRYRTYALDLWGFGDSDRRGEGYTIAGYTALVQRFLDEMGIRQAPMIGHALGGVVALSFAASAPDRSNQVMAVSTPLDRNSIGRPLSTLSAEENDILVRVLGRRQAASYPEVQEEAHKTDCTAIVNSVQAVIQGNLQSELDSLRVPVLLTYGDQDPLISAPSQDWLARTESNIRAISFDESRHFPMLEEANKFNRLLRDFLDAGDDLQALELKDEWRRRVR
jgi:pimeloyl-ACP methyl ester carboxylesterase